MSPPYDVITFDCYGTLVDWNTGLRAALRAAVEADGGRPDPDDLLATYHQVEPIVESESHRAYREVLTETASRAAEQLGHRLSADAARHVPDSLPHWPAFPDTNQALRRLHGAGYRLGILSNVDDDLLAGTLQQFETPFEIVVTAQQVGSYKPASAHFVTARRIIGDAGWLHAAQSYFHDVAPTLTLGIPVAWINRHHESLEGRPGPDRQFFTLTGLADWLTAEGPGSD